MHKNGSGRTILDGCHTPQHGLLMTFCSRAYQFLLNWTNVLYRRLPIYTKKDQKWPKSIKMVVIQIQSQFWNQFWSLIPKMISDFIFFLTRSIILGTQKCQKTLFLVLRKCHFSWKKFKFETVFGISDQNWFQNCLWIWILAIFKDFGRFWSFLVYIGYLL